MSAAIWNESTRTVHLWTMAFRVHVYRRLHPINRFRAFIYCLILLLSLALDFDFDF